MYIKYQPNPNDLDNIGDCSVRAISKCFNCSWDDAFLMLTTEAFRIKNMPSANATIASVLTSNGYKEHSLMSMCKDCYTLEKFARDVGVGTYVCFGDGHVVTMIRTPEDHEAKWFDSYNSKSLPVLFYFQKEEPLAGEKEGVKHGNE